MSFQGRTLAEWTLGTFARVWLARLANPAIEDKDKVFALKILRKTDSKLVLFPAG